MTRCDATPQPASPTILRDVYPDFKYRKELDFTDLPKDAKMRLTSPNTLVATCHLTKVSISVLSKYHPPGAILEPYECRQCLLIEGHTELSVRRAKTEVERVIQGKQNAEESLQDSKVEGMQGAGGGIPEQTDSTQDKAIAHATALFLGSPFLTKEEARVAGLVVAMKSQYDLTKLQDFVGVTAEELRNPLGVMSRVEKRKSYLHSYGPTKLPENRAEAEHGCLAAFLSKSDSEDKGRHRVGGSFSKQAASAQASTPATSSLLDNSFLDKARKEGFSAVANWLHNHPDVKRGVDITRENATAKRPIKKAKAEIKGALEYLKK